jgi:hypothetical protein
MPDLSPMQIHDQIDVVSLSPDEQSIILSLCETRKWDSQGKHLLDLQTKLKNYLHFIENGQLVQKYPDAMGKPVIIRLYSQFKPTPQVTEFIELVKMNWFAPASIPFELSELR